MNRPALIFMSERIRDPHNTDPHVIRIQHPDGAITDAFEVRLCSKYEVATVRYSHKPNPKIKTNKVRAWIEADDRDVVPSVRESKYFRVKGKK